MGKQPNLYSFSSVAELCPTLRRYVIEAQNTGIRRHGIFKVGVSGGSLPATLAKALLAPSTGPDDVVNFAKWEVFFADERAVPLDHEDSNYKLFKDEVLDKIEGAQPVVHSIDVAHLDDTQELADQYEQLLVRSFASRDSVKLPTFDLLLLGCGPDGHTCSLFPNHPLLRETDAWVFPIEDSPKPPSKRITLSLPVVTHAVKIAFVATGASKKDVLAPVFDGGVQGDEARGLPIALVNDAGGDRVSWFVDDDAVKGVRYPRRGSL